MRYLLLAFGALIVFIIVTITVYLGPDDLARCEAPEPLGTCSRVDAIVAVSGGDTVARTDEAIRLYKEGWAPQLIFSGAAADSSGPSNAEAMQRRAVAAGIPASNIVIEEFSRTTAENALNTSQFIADRKLKKIILVTSAYHQRRASLEFGANLGPAVDIVNHPVARDKQWVGAWWWTTKNGWWLAVGELVKIVAFYGQQGVSPS